MRHSTSPPCGNLVDGLPHDCHTKTIAKRARVEPRTQVHTTMKYMFSIIFRKGHALGNFRNSFRSYIEDLDGDNKIEK